MKLKVEGNSEGDKIVWKPESVQGHCMEGEGNGLAELSWHCFLLFI